MGQNQKTSFLAALCLGGTLLLSSCSATTDENGAANLNCSGKVVPGVEYRIQRLHNVEDNTLSCGTFRGDLPGPNRVQFRVFEVVKSGLPTGGGDDEAPTAGLQDANAEEILVPRAGIAFAPYLGSNLNMSALRTNPEFQVDPTKCTGTEATPDCIVSPYVYMGVVTPSAEWCSDASGVMTYEFWMTCNGSSSTFSASVVSGAIVVESTYNFIVGP